MSFVAIPDGNIDRGLIAALESKFGGPEARHRSGRPWIYADRSKVQVLQGQLESELRARISPSNAAFAADSATALRAHSDGWTLFSRRDSSEARGSLSSSHRICWTRCLGTVVLSDRADTLAQITGRELDPHRLMLAMCDSLPSLPFGASSFWRGVSVLLPCESLEVSSDRVRTTRWWTPPDADMARDEAAAEVRDALKLALIDATEGPDSVSCDLSGGLDSASLVFLLHELGTDFSTFRAFSADARNPDREWARRAVKRLGHIRHVELASSSETLQAFGFGEVAGRSDEPLLWKANIGHLQELATALSAHRSPVHVNGLGGDELFTFLPGSLHAAWQARLPGRRQLAARARAMNRWNRLETGLVLRQTPSFAEHLRLQGSAVAAKASFPGPAVCSWLPPVRVPALATPAVRLIIADALRDVPAALEPYARTHGHHQAVEGVVFQGSIVRTVNQLFGGSMTWASPMLDQSVVTARLRMVDGIAGPEGITKPLLAQAMAPIMPAEYFRRRDKGDYSHDVYQEFARHRSRMRGYLSESILADLGVLDMDAVNRLLDAGTQHNADLFDLERVIELERWSRAAAQPDPVPHEDGLRRLAHERGRRGPLHPRER